MNKTWLAHHGILGQRWGIRRFQDKRGRLTTAGKKRYSDNNHKSEEHGEKEKFWTDERKAMAKKIAIGTAVVAGVALASYGTYKLYQNGKLNPIIDKFRKEGQNSFKDLEGENIKQLTDDPENLSSYSATVQKAYFKLKNDAYRVNPTNSNINCGPCSILMHVNDRLGSNYQAGSGAMSNYEGLSKFFKGWDKTKNTVHVDKSGFMTDNIEEAYSDMLGYMKSYGNGASGVCSGHWQSTNGKASGHFLSWKVVDDTVIFSDGQNGTVYLDDAFDNIFKHMDRTSLAFSRLDQLEILKDALNEISYNEKKGV